MTPGFLLNSRYRIQTPLGEGGMGAVYRAVDERLNKSVAVKEMRPQPHLPPPVYQQLRQQFQQEAITLAHLNHPHLVSVTDFFEAEGNLYLVMDLIEGESLAHRIERLGRLSEQEVLTWAYQLLDALVYCHHANVLHRDIKPQNIIISHEQRCVLVDFGLVKLWNPQDPRTHTIMRGMGTPEYAPPEQYDVQLGHTDARSDIYSLGATLYHALTGQVPPTATQRIVYTNLLTPDKLQEQGVHPILAAIILRAMALQPADRFASAQVMRSSLVPQSPASVDRPVPKLPLRYLSAGVAFVGILVFFSLGIWFLTRDGEHPFELTGTNKSNAAAITIVAPTNTADPPTITPTTTPFWTPTFTNSPEPPTPTL